MPRTLWHHPDFLKLWTGQAVSQIGSRITREGLPLTAVLILAASPFQMGVLSGASAGAVLVFGLFAGAWADRLRRRPLLIAADLLRAALLASVPMAAALHRLGMLHLYLVAAAGGLLTVLFDVAYQAYVPSLVERDNILEANTKLTLSESVAEVAGPGLTGVLVQLLTAPVAIAFDAASFVSSAVSLWLIRKPEPRPEPRPKPHMGHEIAEGLRLCWSDPYLRALAGRTATGALFQGFVTSMYILFALRVLHLNAAILGFIIAVGGVSSLLGAALAERIRHRFGFGATFIGSALLAGAASLIPPLAHGSVAVCSAFLAVAQFGDFAWPIYSIHETTLRQIVTPPALLGRVNSAMHLMFRGVLPAGALAGGALAMIVGIRATMFLGGAGFLLSTFWLICSPVRSLRKLPST
jgi:predicted MFS family arabinose efflux permease